MHFRKDINGLRAVAVIAVLLFHFNPTLVPGGFAGVDVFFVISGFLMTGIIFRGIEKGDFSILKFYIARADRIIPPLALLCLALLIFGWFYLAPLDYKTLSKHIAGSIAFLSNIVYWSESGYFTTASHSKWLLHTWSLSTEWQFYFIYPLVLVVLFKLIPLKRVKKILFYATVLGFIFCVVYTYILPSFSYFLLPSRAWEMMVGGLAYLYPLKLKNKNKLIVEWFGVILVFTSYFLFTKDSLWPGYLAVFPVLGAFLIIQAQRADSFVTGNFISQKLGSWSYSIYLWHWPFVVAIYYFSLNEWAIYLGITLSIFLGFLSHKYIEKIKFTHNFSNIFSYFKCKSLYMAAIVAITGTIIFMEKGFLTSASPEYQYLIKEVKSSPYRDKCHIGQYQDPALSCEYFGDKISWASLGDSHSVEIAYALAEKLKLKNLGLKQFSFSGCKPSYGEDSSFSKCSLWYNEAIDYILHDKNISNVVFNHRYTWSFFGGNAASWPEFSNNSFLVTDEVNRMTNSIDALIIKLAKNKENVYVFYPIPELPRDIDKLIGLAYIKDKSLANVLGTSSDWYEQRNRYIINHFNNAKYPSNVHLLKTKSLFCDEINCFAVKDGMPLYFDDDHPSMLASEKLVKLIKLK